MKRNSGFTLIELIVVMVILGILAATAAPKFINLQSDAKIAALKGLSGAVNSAKSLIYAKALVQGFENTATTSSPNIVNGKNLALVWGYPAALDGKDAKGKDAQGIIGALDVAISTDTSKDDSADWFAFKPDSCTTTNTTCIRFVKNDDGDVAAIKDGTSKCYVEYTEATTVDGKMGNMPMVKTETSGCL